MEDSVRHSGSARIGRQGAQRTQEPMKCKKLWQSCIEWPDLDASEDSCPYEAQMPSNLLNNLDGKSIFRAHYVGRIIIKTQALYIPSDLNMDVIAIRMHVLIHVISMVSENNRT